MFGLTGFRLYGLLGTALAFALLLGWALRLDALRGSWKDKYDRLTGQAAKVLVATRIAADNPDLDWTGTAGQVTALGHSNHALKLSIEQQNMAIDDMAREAVRLRARAAELQRIADKARAQRASALKRLSDLSITPGTRDDCMTLLQEAEEALDLVYEAGI